MLIETDKMIPLTMLQKELSRRLREVSDSSDPLFIIRNNEPVAVILSVQSYESLKQAEDILDRIDIAETVRSRQKGQESSGNEPEAR